nr:VCBS domain-containing protein [Chlorobium phaeovibrioides]
MQATARAVQFNNSSDTPGTASRTVTFTAADSHNASATTTQTVTVTALNDAPRLANTADPALSFTASSLSYAEFPDVDDSITTAFTLETWVKFDSLDGVQFISGQAVEQMELHTNGAVLRFIPTGGAYFDTGDVLVVGQWTHIAATYDASTDTAHIYINGVEVSCTDNNHDTDAVLKSTGSYYELARRGDNSFYMNGDIAEFRIWNDVRTAAEVSGSMNGALQGTEAGLVALWKLDEGSGTTLADATANKFNGTAYNTTTWDTRSVTGGLSVAFTEDGSPVHPFSGVILGTVETGQSIIALTLTVSNVSDTTESLGIDGSTIALTNGASGTTATNGVGYSVSVSSGTATVTMSKAEGISASDAGTLINGISYSNSSQAPSTGATRTVTITSLKDSGGSAGGGSDTASLNVAATVSVHAVNDAPVLAAQTLSITETASYDTFSIEKGRFGATDAEGDSIVFSLVDSTTVPSGAVDSEGYDFVQNGAYGDLYIQTDGDYAFVPDNGAINALTNNVSESFKIRATADGQTAESTFTVSITAVNDTPTITTYVSTADITTGLPATAYSADGSSPSAEVVEYAFDDNVNTKYLNFSGVGSSVTVDAGANYVVTSLGLTTANDALNRDPAHFILYGSTDNASFTQIAAAALTPPAERYTDYPTVSFSNSTSYRYYRLAFDQSTGGGGDSYIQVAEIRLGGETSNVILYTENAQVNALENVILRDNEHGSLASATVTISGNYENASDSLSFTNNNTGLYGSITASFVSSTGVLSLSGSATVEQYQNALRAVTYASSSDNPTLNSPTRTLSWQVNDGAADSSVATSTITITPVNDAPALAGAGNTLAFTEGSSPAVIDASLALSDADDTTIASAAVTISGGYVSTEDVLACTSQNGITSSWNGSAGVLTLTGSATIAQYKAALESITYQNTNTDNPNIGNRTISWVVNDAALGSSPVTSTITVAGVNDAPTVSSSITGSASEGASSITFNLLADASDVDDSSLNITGVTYTVGGVSTGNSGVDVPAGFSLSGVTLTVDPAAAAFDDLADRADRTIVASYTIADGSGGAVAQTATITITGTNDLPTVTNADTAKAGTVTESGHTDDGIAVAGTATATGTLSSSDVDASATATWSLQGTPSTTYGTMAINESTGVWTYTLDNSLPATQALKEGESATETYTARVTDDKGAYVDQTITITISGTNDVPVVTNDAAALAGAVVEAGSDDDGAAVAGTAVATGTLSASDVDADATQTYSLDGDVDETYGTMVIDSTSGVWTYTLDNALAATQALDEGDSVNVTYTARVTDDKGAYVDQTITITISGTNDVPVVTNDAAALAGAVVEAGSDDDGAAVAGTAVATGTVSASDVDADATQTYSLDGDVDETYGTMVIDSTSGVWTYTLDNALAATQALDEGDSVNVTYTARVTDDKGAYVDQTITITISGTNDVPVVTNDAAALAGAVVEAGSDDDGAAVAGTAVATGTVSASDVDADATQTYSLDGDVDETYGTMVIDSTSGVWTYTLDNALAATQALDEGDSVNVTYTARVTDDKGAYVDQTITITISGTNDVPVVTNDAAALAGAVVEAGSDDDGAAVAGTAVATGTVSASDVDADATQTYSLDGDVDETYGTMVIDSTSGVWTYTLDNALAATQALDEGDSVNVTYTARVTDDKGAYVDQTITITISGTNDVPVVTNDAAALAGAVVEAGSDDDGAAVAGTAVATGTVSASDVDADATQTYSLEGTVDATYGTMAIDSTSGVWTYTLDNALAATQALDEGDSVNVTYTARVTDDQGASVDQTLTVTITGTNDVPVLQAVTAGSITETVQSSATTDQHLSGTLTAADVDGGDSKTYGINDGSGNAIAASDGVVSKAGTYGTLTLNTSTGVYAYTKNVSAIEALDDDESGSDSFTVVVTDSAGAVSSKTYTVSVTGHDDTPTLSAVTSGSITETDLATAVTETGLTGTLSGSDVDTEILTYGIDGGIDLTGVHTGIVTKTGTYGTLSLNRSSGAYQYDRTAASVEALAASESVSDVFTLTVTDGDGALVRQTYTVNLTGADDVPLITVVDVDASITEASTLLDSGSVTFTDVDLSDRPVATGAKSSIIAVKSDGTTALVLSALQESALAAGFSVTNADGNTNNGTVNWEYVIAESALDFLGAGEKVTAKFTITVNDQHGGTATQDVRVRITGANDSPSISLGGSDSASEGLSESNAGFSKSGTLTLSDKDATDTVTPSVYAVSTEGITNSISNTAFKAMLSVDDGAVIASGATGGTIHWAFNSGSEAFNYLAADETLKLTYTLRATDSQSSAVDQAVVITITGTNDTPVVDATDVSGSVIELVTASGNLTDSGTIGFTDTDLSDTHSLGAVTASSGALGALTVTKTVDTTGIGTGGSMTWNYSVAASAVEYLAAGETKVESFTFTVQDAHGGSVTRTVEVTLTGTNDAPVITAGPDTASLSETDAGLSTSGSLTVSDADVTDVVTATRTLSVGGTSNRSDSAAPGDAALLGMFTVTPGTIIDGSHTGSTLGWSFDSGTGKFDYLQKGETLVLTYTVSATDDNGTALSDSETVTITITGTNDTPVITNGNDTAALTETDAALTASGTMAVMDLDTADTVDIAVESVSRGGTFGGTVPLTNVELKAMLGVSVQSGSISALGADGAAGTEFGWTFTSGSSGSGAFDFLREGETLVLTYTLKATDNSGAGLQEASPSATSSVVVTVTGTNDAPTLSEVVSGSIIEDPSATTVKEAGLFGSLRGSDADNAPTLVYGIDGLAATGGTVTETGRYGTLRVNTESGVYLYQRNVTAVEALDEGQIVTDSFVFTVTDELSLQATSVFRVLLQGSGEFIPLIPLEKPSTVRPAENVSSILTDVPAVADQQPASDSGPPVVGSTALVIQGVDVSVDPFGDTGSSKQSLASSVQNAVVETVAFPESVQGPEQQRAESLTAQMDTKEESVIEVDMREKGAYRIPESIQSLSQSASSQFIYEASLLDGSPLPEGVRFDSLTQSFVVTGKLYGDIEIVVRARDGSGNETKTIYRLEFGSEDGESGNEQDGLQVEKLQGAAGRRLPDADIPFTRMGRAALSEQLAEAGRWGLFRQRHQLLAQLEALENPEAVDA